MWVAVHVYVTFKKSAANKDKSVLLEENIVLMNVQVKQDVFDRLDELKEMFGGNFAYPNYERIDQIGVRKIVSILNLDGDNVSPPTEKSEVTYELYEFVDDAGIDNFIKGKCVHAEMETAIKRRCR